MRILSQDGTIDMPYELLALSISRKNNGAPKDEIAFCVNAHSGSLNAKRIIMGEYSSEEKAKKAMEMLWKAYCGIVEINPEITQKEVEMIAESIRNGAVYPNAEKQPEVECKYFQFPADEDVEV